MAEPTEEEFHAFLEQSKVDPSLHVQYWIGRPTTAVDPFIVDSADGKRELNVIQYAAHFAVSLADAQRANWARRSDGERKAFAALCDHDARPSPTEPAARVLHQLTRRELVHDHERHTVRAYDPSKPLAPPLESTKWGSGERLAWARSQLAIDAIRSSMAKSARVWPDVPQEDRDAEAQARADLLAANFDFRRHSWERKNGGFEGPVITKYPRPDIHRDWQDGQCSAWARHQAAVASGDKEAAEAAAIDFQSYAK